MSDSTNFPFLDAIRAGHLFFYDLEEDEIVHLRREIFEAAQRSSDGIDIELSAAEQADAEDAWEILEDSQGRYEAMPPISEETLETWKKEFGDAQGPEWDAFYAEKFHDELVAWLDDFDADPFDGDEPTLH